MHTKMNHVSRVKLFERERTRASHITFHNVVINDWSIWHHSTSFAKKAEIYIWLALLHANGSILCCVEWLRICYLAVDTVAICYTLLQHKNNRRYQQIWVSQHSKQTHFKWTFCSRSHIATKIDEKCSENSVKNDHLLQLNVDSKK